MAIFEYKHPLISHKLSILRNVETDTKLFRESLNEFASLMVYEATKDLKLKNITVKTPIQETITQVLDEPVL
ncbi:Uracil phosphoribosyltransferase [Streptobacillus moniliformis]|nr:Uracil phosphoribosyltransferase [Streptobacillus moniliformis]